MSGDPWRWRCPEKHCSWEPRGENGYYCEMCDRLYDELIDVKTGRAHTTPP